MSTVNRLLRPLFDALLSPFSGLPAWVGLTVVSLVVSVFMLLIYKRFSNQAKLEAVKQQIYAGIFEIRLFNDDFRAILRAQGEILRHNLRYLGYSLVPMAWMLVPLLLVVAQLQFHYGYEGLKPGEPTLVKVKLKEDWSSRSLAADAAGKPRVALQAPAGLKIETPPVWSPSEKEIAWRVVAEQPGTYELTLDVGGTPLTKTAVSSTEVARRSPIRVAPAFFDQLLYPAEDPLPAASPVESITLGYPEAEVSLLGFGMHWIIAFFILTVVFAFALKGLFGVTI
jgi:uncharacterized membrane protein (DUF106 family)